MQNMNNWINVFSFNNSEIIWNIKENNMFHSSFYFLVIKFFSGVFTFDKAIYYGIYIALIILIIYCTVKLFDFIDLCKGKVKNYIFILNPCDKTANFCIYSFVHAFWQAFKIKAFGFPSISKFIKYALR